MEGLHDEETSEPLVPLTKPPRKRKRTFVVDEEEEAQPTYMRKTDRGGYSHTNLSKSRISKANSGNKPWNFGKRRSSADKAKIAAGVRARNRTLLLQKLKRLGLTEEEYDTKKREIKYLRERIRRAKKANAKFRDKTMEKKLQDAIDATNTRKVDNVKEEKKADEQNEVDLAKKEDIVDMVVVSEGRQRKGIFSEEITFSNSERDYAYDKLCSGPGGLICCERCSEQYNAFLTKTLEDVETHRIVKESREVTEILEFLSQKKEELKDAVESAKTKIPPLPPPGLGRLTSRQDEQTMFSRPNNGNRKSGIPSESDMSGINTGAWNLTSAIDIGVAGGLASV